MTPEQVAVITTVATILERVGTWPVGSVLIAIAFGPWMMMILISRAQEKRFDAITKMYENNVELVKNYEGVAKILHDTVVYNTQTLTQVKDTADNNLFCPMIKQQTKRTEVNG